MKSGGLRSWVESWRTALVCLGLVLGTLAVYWQVGGFEFTNYDESVMILKNPHVLGGLTREGLWWALTTTWFDYWHPLPWMSHMLDCELFGLNAGAHHLVNLGFHVANTLLLFAALRRMTGAFWRSAMVAALFALHPLHVQSVAWVAERKDVLSGFFFMLTLWAYAGYAESLKSKVQSLKSEGGMGNPATRNTQHATGFYLLALAFFACGLMSKPMLVTLPFVLLLLDYWPLGRLSFPTLHPSITPLLRSLRTPSLHHSPTPLLRLLWEKLPFFALTAVLCVVTSLVVEGGGNIVAPGTAPWGLRLANVPVSYVRYLGKTIWPAGLAALYPMPSHWAWWRVSGALAVLAACTLVALARLRRQPWLAVGWCWFLGMLVPVIALVPVWHIAMADRYTYLPLVGIFMAVVWEGNHRWTQINTDKNCSKPRFIAARICSLFREPKQGEARPESSPQHLCLSVFICGALLVLCGYVAWVQTGYWRNSLTLWARALAVTKDNARAEHNYGFALEQGGQLEAASQHYLEAVRIEPKMYEAQNNLGRVLYRLGQLHEATNHLMQAVRLDPGGVLAQANLGGALAALGDWRGAREHYEAAMAADPGNATIPADWGKALLAANRAQEARDRFAQALQLDPRSAEARTGCAFALSQLGAALAAQGKLAEAAGQYREALRFQPDLPEVLNNLAWLLATASDAGVRNGPEAVRSARRACELTQYRQALMVGTLAAAYAEAGQFEAARGAAQKAIALAEAAGQNELAARNRELLKLYEAGKPCRQ